jgi:DNA-directed RNA polymerase subunit RPC12/RpoP
VTALIPSEEMPAAQTYEVVCPHCKKTFRGELLGEADRRQGFKCPHCRLFVPYDRAAVDDEVAD